MNVDGNKQSKKKVINMELHQLAKSIRNEKLLAGERLGESLYWEGRYALAKQLLKEVEPYKKNTTIYVSIVQIGKKIAVSAFKLNLIVKKEPSKGGFFCF